MIGKLQSWRSDHGKSKEWRHSGVGGLVSIEDLQKKPKTPPTTTKSRKKVPFLNLGSKNVTLKSLQAVDDDRASTDVAPPVDLFSNIPASAGLNSTFSRSETSRPASPSRPKTADPHRESFARRRSKTAGSLPQLSLDFADEPMPLNVDFDEGRKRSVSVNNSRRPSVQDSAAAGSSIARPRTSNSVEPSSRKRSNSTASKSGKAATYSLTPAISPAESRRPSLTGQEIQKIAAVALAKTTSNTSTTSPARQRSNSHTSITNFPPPDRPAPIPSPARSVLDEVGGTLSATIRDIAAFQDEWAVPEDVPDVPGVPVRMSSLMYNMPTPSTAPSSAPHTAPPTQEYFPPVRAQTDVVRTMSSNSQTSNPPSRSPSAKSATRSIPGTPHSGRAPDPPSLGRMQSIQIAYEKSKSTAHKLGVENDTLKQQMKFLRERFAEIGEMKNEKETLQAALEDAQTHLKASLEQLQLSKSNETALSNNLTNITRRLEEANAQKVDALELNGDLQDSLSGLQKELAAWKKENEELKKRPEIEQVEDLKAKMEKMEEENKHLAEQAKAAEGRADLPAMVADLTFKLSDTQRAIAEKDKYITELESASQNHSSEIEALREEHAKLADSNSTLRVQHQKATQANKRLSTLTKQIEDMEKARTAAVAESDKHLQLLKEQLRRNANDVHKLSHPASNLLEKKLNIEEAITEVRLKFERRMAGELDAAESDMSEKDRIDRLEKEIEYHVKDIVLYKLDVKGYRKDLKRAKEKIATLQDSANNSMASRTPSPPSSTVESSPVKRPPVSTTTVQSHQRKISSSDGSVKSPSSATDSASPDTPAIATALQVQLPVMHIVNAWSPGVSPRSEVKNPMVQHAAVVSAS